MQYALKFAYDGSEFDGYARQPNQYTVEGEILSATRALGTSSDFQSASRTDKGVSAAGNVIALTTDFEEASLIPALNSKSENIKFHGFARVDENFNPRYAKQRWYRYILLNKKNYKPDVINETAGVFLGEHDFRHFSKTDKDKQNTVLSIDSITVFEDGQFLIFDIKAQRFLWQMIRRIVSATLMMVDNRISKTEITDALDGQTNHPPSIAPVPPEQLILMDIIYDFTFEKVHEPASVFRSREEAALTRAKVLNELSSRIAEIPETHNSKD